MDFMGMDSFFVADVVTGITFCLAMVGFDQLASYTAVRCIALQRPHF